MSAAIASFHSGALFTSFARQTDEPENPAERETLRFRVRRRKRGGENATGVYFFVVVVAALLPRASSDRSEYRTRDRRCLDFCPSSVFLVAILLFDQVFSAAGCATRARRIVCRIVRRRRGQREEERYHRCRKKLTIQSLDGECLLKTLIYSIIL